MPTVGVIRDDLFERLGRTYTEEEFDELCFEFGIELDEVTSEAEMATKEQKGKALEGLDTTVIYKIDIPANRYDLLCIEGITRALRIFKGLDPAPTYRMLEPEQPQVMRVKSANCKTVPRPFVVSAVLRGMTFDEKAYKSFIDLQDKLHQNICRERKLVAIGTHDLDTIEGPFTYDAPLREDISLVPLTTTDGQPVGAKDLLDHYNTDEGCKHLKPYTKLIYDSERYPLITDAKGTVLSMPPIINGHHSRIQLHTKNVLIEATATDHTKAHIVLDTVVTMFSEYCAEKFTVEPVTVIYENEDGSEDWREVTPRLSTRTQEASLKEICSYIDVELEGPLVCELCTKMQLGPVAMIDDDMLRVTIPPTRSDILHEVDIVEDVAIAYGFNKLLPGTMPATLTVGAPLPINHLSDLLRDEVARAGYTEVLTHGLCMRAEVFGFFRRLDDGSAVSLSNPANREYEVVRTSLLVGLLKTIGANKSMPIKNGIKFFEISDVVLQDPENDVGARNERHLAAVYTGFTDGFEVLHGLLDRVMTLNQVALGGDSGRTYRLEASTDPLYLEGRQGKVMLYLAGREPVCVGYVGAIHPEVLAKDKFDLDNPCSALELNIELFM
eukprot:CAMPEP_0185769292 /NCGR_PEP_ID=MMETSP1174-20130828/53494_1 /TAXON_ID=35687 /ORGANISM="Dictyocha speculum, Strain CCMP1381" /LENGTH=610 /DNA_ID=CAMNT_0028454291 /DNA_START=69 /DNA_END=1901 /DNA_ORIENTATION=-